MLQITKELLKDTYHISLPAIEMVENAHRSVEKQFALVEAVREFNQLKVLHAFQENGVAARHFAGSTGYGYDDIGRDMLDKVYAAAFRTEAALVRPHFASATHALGTALFGLLRPGDTMLSITGRPYDTILPVIGLEGQGMGSLIDYGIQYDEIELKDGSIDLIALEEKLSKLKPALILIQRSRGYSWRRALSIAEIGDAIALIHRLSPLTVVLTDNCYGEFVEPKEPSEVGADILVGSLIKNPGGGLAPTGAYIAGKKELVEKISYRFTVPGIGAEVGSYTGGYLQYYQGFYLAPHIVGEAMKAAVLSARVFEELGFEVMPASDAERSDITQSVCFGDAQTVIDFCRAIQASSPVDSNVTPLPWDMPGYSDQVIMAAGTFIQGASIELSADAPMREPYIAYLQGSLTYEQCLAAMCLFVQTTRK